MYPPRKPSARAYACPRFPGMPQVHLEAANTAGFVRRYMNGRFCDIIPIEEARGYGYGGKDSS